MEDNSKISPKIIINFCIYVNCCLALTDRILQIIYFTSTTFINDDIKSNLLLFILIKPISLILIYFIYIVTLDDSLLQFCDRVKLFICFIFSQEFSYSLGTHYSLKSKYSREGDNPVFTIRVLNGFHIMLTSIPQLICVPIHSVAINYFGIIETLSILFSSIFLVWSIIYLFICNCYSEDFESQINEMIYD